jgi:methylated-DNA-[protein]-cysteine S-methyltransferase
MTLFTAPLETPLGTFLGAVDASGAVVAIDFEREGRIARMVDTREDRAQLAPLARALERYFAGQLRAFELPLAAAGTPFQKRVWDELVRIPYGVTIGYAELARRIGSPRAVRAVGGANGANPIPILVPCHRVIGSDGSLTGFGGGIARKQALLELETRHSGQPLQLDLVR